MSKLNVLTWEDSVTGSHDVVVSPNFHADVDHEEHDDIHHDTLHEQRKLISFWEPVIRWGKMCFSLNFSFSEANFKSIQPYLSYHIKFGKIKWICECNSATHVTINISIIEIFVFQNKLTKWTKMNQIQFQNLDQWFCETRAYNNWWKPWRHASQLDSISIFKDFKNRAWAWGISNYFIGSDDSGRIRRISAYLIL